MKVRVFDKNANGKIEFTRKELEALLNEVYNEGYSDANSKNWTVTYGDSLTGKTSDYLKEYYTTSSPDIISTTVTCDCGGEAANCVGDSYKIDDSVLTGQISFADTNPDVFSWSSLNG